MLAFEINTRDSLLLVDLLSAIPNMLIANVHGELRQQPLTQLSDPWISAQIVHHRYIEQMLSNELLPEVWLSCQWLVSPLFV